MREIHQILSEWKRIQWTRHSAIDLSSTLHYFKIMPAVLRVCYFVLLFAKSVKALTEQINLTTWSETVTSPNYPQTYPTNSNISWIISVSFGNRIQLHIFSLQTQCNGDSLLIRDGNTLTSPLIARYCGKHISLPVITSYGTHMLLHFVSDNITDSSSNAGFTSQYNGVCEVHLNATNGIVTTPNYPNQYPNYLNCLWQIELHPSVLIILECHDFALEQKEGCSFDYMEVLAGVSPDSPVIGRYCGAHNETLVFEREGNISIKFKSDGDKEFRGFRCAYNIYKVRGYWTEWTNWTECSRTCHHGNQTRHRTCVNPLPGSGLQLVCDAVPDTERRGCLISNCSNTSSSGATSFPSSSVARILYSEDRSITTTPPNLNVSPSKAEDSVIDRSLAFFSLDPSQTMSNFLFHNKSIFGSASASMNWDSKDVNPKTTSALLQNYSPLSKRASKSTVYTSQERSNPFVSASSSQLHFRALSFPQTISQSQRTFPAETSTSENDSGMCISQHAALMSFTDRVSLTGVSSVFISHRISSSNTSRLVKISRTYSVNVKNYANISIAVSGTTVYHIFSSKSPLLSGTMDIESVGTIYRNMLHFSKGKISSRISEIGLVGFNTFRTSFSTKGQHEAISFFLSSSSQSALGLNTTTNTHQTGTKSLTFMKANRIHGYTELLETSSVSMPQYTTMPSTHSTRYLPMGISMQSTDTFNAESSITGKTRKLSLLCTDGNTLDTTLYILPSCFQSSGTLLLDYSTVTSSMTGKITSERSLSTAVTHTSSIVTQHSLSRGYDVIFERTERKDRSSTRGTMYSTPQRISLTSNKYYKMISLSTGIGAPSSSYAIHDSITTTNAKMRRTSSDDLKTTRDYLTFLSTGIISVSPSSAINNWKTTKTTGITTTDSLQFYRHSTPFTISTRIRLSSSYDFSEGENTKSAGLLPNYMLNSSVHISYSLPGFTSLTASFISSIRTSQSLEYTTQNSMRHLSYHTHSSFHAASTTHLASSHPIDSHKKSMGSISELTVHMSDTVSSSATVVPSAPPDAEVPSVSQFPWHLIPFIVIILMLLVALFTYCLRIADIIDAIILAIKERRKLKGVKHDKNAFRITQGNFSTAGLNASSFHSYQRELFYEDDLNFALFEDTKDIEFSVELDEELQHSDSEESVEMSCVMEEESKDEKPIRDTLKEMFDTVDR